jgi:hypothetical protein
LQLSSNEHRVSSIKRCERGTSSAQRSCC